MKKFLAASVLLLLFVVDRAIKYYFYKNPTINFGGDFFYNQLSFHFVKNFGIAFGLPVFGPILFGLIIIILFFLISFLLSQIKEKKYELIFPLTLIIVGAISNLIDRIKFGFVVDYIDLTWFTVFNLADCLITFGVLLFLFFSYRKKTDKRQSLPIL